MSDCVMEVEKVSSVKISASNEKLQRELRRVREENRTRIGAVGEHHQVLLPQDASAEGRAGACPG